MVNYDSMNIALCHFRVGETDGVSLEMEKWKKALEMQGHGVFYIAGSSGNCAAEIIPELHYQDLQNKRIVANAYGLENDYPDEKSLQNDVLLEAEKIEKALLEIIKRRKPDVLIPNNIFSLGWNLAAAKAFFNAISKTGIRAVCHHHDFHWERDLYSDSRYAFVKKMLLDYFPPVHHQIEHVCINKLAVDELSKRYSVEAKVVPNVFDFEMDYFKEDEFNRDIRSAFGLKDKDIVFLQATRIVERKAIEIAIDLVMNVLNLLQTDRGKVCYNGNLFDVDSKFYLILAGQCESPAYYAELKKYASELNVELIDISNRVAPTRGTNREEKIYSFWDVYQLADIVTYPSVLEGWGNQLLEAFAAKLPVAVFEYPVYRSDIAPYSLKIISLGHQYKMENGLVHINPEFMNAAAQQARLFLFDADYRNKCVEKNYSIVKKEFSVRRLSNQMNFFNE